MDEFGAKSLRVGGASDIFDELGREKADTFIDQMGRWKSDIHDIYARLSAARQADVGEQMMHSTGRDLEQLATGWVQPARRWR